MKTIVRWFKNWACKPGSKKIYWEKVISSSIVVIGFLIFAIYNQGRVNRRIRERTDFPRYTIGLTLGSYSNVKGSKTIKYKYYVNGILYTTWGSYPVLINNIVADKGKYFVKFSALDPSNAEMLFDHMVPDNIGELPDSGLSHLK